MVSRILKATGNKGRGKKLSPKWSGGGGVSALNLKKDSSQGMRSVGGKFCQCQYFECTCYFLLPLQVITLVSIDFNSNNLP